MLRQQVDDDTATLAHRVTEADLATQWENDVPVLATPVLLWLGEVAAMRVVEASLAEDEMTVGCGHDAQHLAPTPLGATVEVTARLVARDGPTLTFDVEASDGIDTIFTGRHTRAVVRRSRFLQRVEDKSRRTAELAAAPGRA